MPADTLPLRAPQNRGVGRHALASRLAAKTKSRGADGASHRPPRHPTSLFHHKTGHAENSRGRAQETGVLTAYSAAVRLSAKSLADDAIGSRTTLGRAEAAARRAARVGVPSGNRLSSCAHCSTA
jgi:hypothetical protein